MKAPILRIGALYEGVELWGWVFRGIDNTDGQRMAGTKLSGWSLTELRELSARRSEFVPMPDEGIV